MPATLATADAALKDDYGPNIVEYLNNANTFLSSLKMTDENFEGRRFVRPIHTKRNSGVGARPEGGTLPAAGAQGYTALIGPVRYVYARIQLTGPFLAQMRRGAGAFTNGLDSEMQGVMNDAARDLTRQAWGTSDGKICDVGTSGPSTTVSLAATTKKNQMRWLEDGALIDIGTTGAPASVASAREVTAVDYVNKTITISGAAVTVNGTQIISRSGAYGASTNTGNPGDGQIELTGVRTQVSDSGILFTVNPATYARHKAGRYANGGTNRAISENLVTTALMDVQVNVGTFVDLLIGSDGVFRAYGNLLAGLKRVVQDVSLPGGYSGLSINAVGYGGPGAQDSFRQVLTWDRDCWDNALYGFSTSVWEAQTLEDWNWMDNDGSVLSRVSGQDAYEATLKTYREHTAVKRNANFVIDDITEA